MNFRDPNDVPILANKNPLAPSAFTPESLLREARRQRGLPLASVPPVCVLDPDGDIVRFLRKHGRAEQDRAWACYHTELYRHARGELELGFVPFAVGAPFAVLVAEQLFASGCRLLLSITSAGQLADLGAPPYFVLIEKALRDEGTSYHYMAPSKFSAAEPGMLKALDGAFAGLQTPVHAGSTWTTDAPFRETSHGIDAMRASGLAAVEMEAAALYAFSHARRKPVLCFAYVTNRMGQIEGDFEKGDADGTHDALALIEATSRIVLPTLEATR